MQAFSKMFRILLRGPAFRAPVMFALLAFACWAVALPATAQKAQPLIQYALSPSLTPDQDHYARVQLESAYVESYRYCTIDLSQFDEQSILIDLFDGVSYQVNIRKKESRGIASFSWFGKHSNPEGSAVFTVNRGMVTGWLHIGKEQYSLYPLGEGLHLIYRVRQTGQQDESDEGYRKMIERSINKQLSDLPEIDPETGKSKDGFLAGNCKVRVAVCYTDNVAAALADELGFVQSCIDVTNDCYNNSSVNFDAELAVTYENAYAETSIADTDLENFQDVSDGELDEIYDMRTYFDADLAVLVVESMTDYCGLAWDVAITDFTSSYCVVKRSCAVDNYSFPHELGHLYGCRHDCYVDGNIIPYACAHGYVNQPEWRTVMAYNTQCEDDGDDCPRIPYFSNPDVSYLGDATGTACFWPFCERNNEDALEDSRDAIADNEVTVDNKSFASETFNDGEGGDIIANLTVTNSSTFDINSGAEMTWRAGSEITLAPGFVAEPGSVFNAFIDECTPLRLQDDNDDEAAEGITRPSGFLVASVFPNPFGSSTTLSLQLLREGNLDIRLYDLTGKELRVIRSRQFFDSGSYSFEVVTGNMAKGVYLLRATLDGQQLVMKITRND